MWHYALARMVVAARAHGLRPIDGPFGDFSDPDGYRYAARRAAALGCEGKWAIHPSQIALAHEVMTPPEAEIAKARRILEAMAQARAEGKGAVSLDGRLIDFGKQREVPMRDLAVELVEFVDDVVDELGSRKDVEYVHTILRAGTSADRQLAVHDATGGDIDRKSVV